jgi:hypothetical protein
MDKYNAVPQNNNGDEIMLLNPPGQTVHRVQYGRNDVGTGQVIVVP